MKLAFVTDSKYYTENGKWYCDLMNYDLIKKFKRHFDHITVVAVERREKMDCVMIDFEGVSVTVIPKITDPKNFIKSRTVIKKTIKSAVAESDAVFCRTFSGIFAQKIAKKLGKPTVTYFGGSDYEIMKSSGNLAMKIAAPFAKYAFKKSALESDNVVYCSPHLINKYPTNGNTFIWTAVHLEKCDGKMREIRLDQDLTSKSEIKVALVGQIYNYVKGVDTAIRAISCLPQKFNLYLLGKGESGRWLDLVKSLNVSDRVHFCGCLSGGKSVLDWLDSMDVYIQPSRTEGLPKATLEAMSRGLPIISSGAGGLTTITKKELIHSTEDYKSLANLMKSVVENRDLYKNAVCFSFEESDKYQIDVLDKIFDSVCQALKGAQVNG